MFTKNTAQLAIALILGWMAVVACSDATDVDNGSGGSTTSGEGGNGSGDMVPMKNGVCPSGTTPELKADGDKTGWCASIPDLMFIDAAPIPPDAAAPDAHVDCSTPPEHLWIKEGTPTYCGDDPQEKPCYLFWNEENCTWFCGESADDPSPNFHDWSAEKIERRCSPTRPTEELPEDPDAP